MIDKEIQDAVTEQQIREFLKYKGLTEKMIDKLFGIAEMEKGEEKSNEEEFIKMVW